MKRNLPRSSHQVVKYKPSRNENYKTSRSKIYERKMQHRRKWMIQHERDREHERLRKKIIMEYELQHARGKDLPPLKLSNRSRSNSRSKSRSRHRRTSTPTPTSTSKKAPVLSERVESSDGTILVFKGPEGTQISASELRNIKVDIHRNIPGTSSSTELQRDIINPEDVVVKRKEGEGSKPIFERDEIKGTVLKTVEVEEYRTVVITKNRKPARTRSHTPCRTSYSIEELNRRSRDHSHSRNREQRNWNKDSRHRDQRYYREYRERSREHSRERRDRDISREDSHERRDRDRSKERSRERRDRDRSKERSRERRDRDRSREHSCERRDRDRSRERSRERRDRNRSRERSRERRDRGRSKEKTVPPQHYIQEIPVPIYYGNFPPRPIAMPLVPIRGQVPVGNTRHPSMIRLLRPYPPRFISSDLYRLHSPQNPSFGD